MIQIDLEMPKCCSECPFDFESDCYKCGITGKICDGKKWNDERLSDCPLKESVIDNIRAEIELFRMNDSSNIFMKAYNDGIDFALKILDRYREGEEE